MGIEKLVPMLLAALHAASAFAAEPQDALDMNVEDLLNVQVTSVSKKAQALNDAAAAVFVITGEDIKRTGATSIPDALRMAPGLDVARIDGNRWAVSARGFSGRFANKLLVLIDGRDTYTRSFAGVYWENQDVMLEDVDRIEVIRGPGATLWGANAVNGVINIITKHSSKTQGGLAAGGAGTEERGFGAFRYGGKLGESSTGRVYMKGFNRDENSNALGGSAQDQWDKVQGGFRLDSDLTLKDEVTLQGDVYHGNIQQALNVPQFTPPFASNQLDHAEIYGGNILGRWKHALSTASDYTLQLFYEHHHRDEASYSDQRDTFDLDFQHRFGMFGNHEVVWGLGYRYNQLAFVNGLLVGFDRPRRGDQLISGFLQDEIELIDKTLWLTLGTKIEHNDYSGFEGQPTARLMWAPHDEHRLWASVSRAVRTPSFGEHEGTALQAVVPPLPPAQPLPAALLLKGNPQFKSENVIAYEIGYRTTFIKSLSLDVTAFYNDYRNLRLFEPGAVTLNLNPLALMQELNLTNQGAGKTYGVEIAANWQMLDWWRWDANYSFLKTEFDGPANQFGISPPQRVSLRSMLSIADDIDFDLWFRYVDVNKNPGVVGLTPVKDYVTLDTRIAWRPVKELELSLIGQNLLNSSHLESVQELQATFPTYIDRGMYGKIAWNF